MNDDMSEFLGVFLDEALEQIALLEQAFLRLEQEPTAELLQEIFRAAHTLKGSSRAMGFVSMGELTHAMEDVFDRLRHDELTVSPELMEALFGGLDALKAMHDEVAAQGMTALDTAAQTARLRAVLKGAPSPAGEAVPPAPASDPVSAPTSMVTLTATQLAAAQDALGAGCSLYQLKIVFAADCVMKSVRAVMALQMLAPISSVLALYPDEEAIENEEFESEIEVIVATEKDMETVRAAVLRTNEVRAVHISEHAENGRLPRRQNTQALPETITQPPATQPIVSEKKTTPREEGLEKTKTTPVVSEISPSNVAVSAQSGGHSGQEGPTAASASRTSPPPVQSHTVRVDVARLDCLLNLVGELVIDRTRMAQLCSQLEAEAGGLSLLETLSETAGHIGRITDELQNEIMKARMLPVDNVFSRFPRMIRDLAQKLGKEIQFVVEGKETELDRSVIEVIGDPLIHMLRNSVDHGIELPEAREQAGKPRQGTVSLRARHQDNHIVIEIEDDGKGLDPEKLRANAVNKGILTQEAAARLTDREAIHLIFASGFSTAQVVSDVSGRGVGMDIVRSNLEKLGALIEIESKVGVGTTFTVKLPLTLAIVRGLLVVVRGCVYALPLNSVVETLLVEADAVHSVGQSELVHQRDQTLSLVRLSDFFALEANTTPAERTLEKARHQERRDRTKPPASPRTAANRARKTDVLEVDISANPDAGNSLAREPHAAGVETIANKRLTLVIVGLGNRQIALAVDSLLGEQEVVIKPLGGFVGEIRGIAGATILGDGRVALIVDVPDLVTAVLEEKGKAHAAGR